MRGKKRLTNERGSGKITQCMEGKEKGKNKGKVMGKLGELRKG